MTNYQMECARRAMNYDVYHRTHIIVKLVLADFKGFDEGNDWEPKVIKTLVEIETDPENYHQTVGDMYQEARDYKEASRIYKDDDIYETVIYFAY